jgi:predicted phosphodiesterase
MTEYAFISDIHGNLPALEAVLVHIFYDLKIPEEHVICLGDVVGYNPWVNECCDRLRENNIKTLKGNHDAACSDDNFSIAEFNDLAVATVEYARANLRQDNKEFLQSLEYSIEKENFALFHANPKDPEGFDYVDRKGIFPEAQEKKLMDPGEAIKAMKKKRVFVGHTHIHGIFEEADNDYGFREQSSVTDNDYPVIKTEELPAGIIRLDKGKKDIVNVGSVGQPRDRDPKAVITVYDDAADTVRYVRVPYNVEGTAKAILEAYAELRQVYLGRGMRDGADLLAKRLLAGK